MIGDSYAPTGRSRRSLHSGKVNEAAMRRLLARSGLLTCLLSAIPALATDYYVAADGNDAHPGTLSAPFATIQHAADLAAAGDTVHIRGGS